ncbi:hypothetical protein N7454_006201 [Penicillium verhagenii]|nr:hypothetical protein N7454_006201 [Penicillium verhagenii]
MLTNRLPYIILIAIVFIGFTWRFLLYNRDRVSTYSGFQFVTPPTIRRPEESAGNGTLGFEHIFALSQRPSWRTRGLQAAAELTSLQITIPPKPPVDDRLAEAFANIGPHLKEKDHPTPGASKAWLGHLDLIKYVYQSNFQNSLILEDDADWDVAIRNQMINISSAVRQLTRTSETDLTPYGQDWDVLWLGHCAEHWDTDSETIIFDDAHVCPHEDYISWTADDLAKLPDHQRAVYRSRNPICTFAYAVSHEGAGRILNQMGAGQGEAFDVQLMLECEKNMRCISVVPEVFHQYFPPFDYGIQSDVDIGNGKGSNPEDEHFEFVIGSTENIIHSARCQALWGQDCQRKK